MKLIATAFYEEVEKGDWRAVGLLGFVALAVERAHFLLDFLFLVERKEVRYLAGV